MTTTDKPNAALAYRVLDHIDAHPEQWNQCLYIGPADCETVACFAGWACLLSGEQPNYAIAGSKYPTAWLVGHEEGRQSVAERAEQLLGVKQWSGLLDEDNEEWNLFGVSNTREELGWLVAEMFGPRPDGGHTMTAREVRVSIDEEAITRATDALHLALGQVRAGIAEIGRLEYQGLGFTVRPWTIETPDGVLTGYVDPDNQNRWAQEGHPIPEGWRKLYVEDR